MQRIEALKQTLAEVDERIAAIEIERGDLVIVAKTLRSLLNGSGDGGSVSSLTTSMYPSGIKKTLAQHFDEILRASGRAMKTAQIFDVAVKRGVKVKNKNTAHSILGKYKKMFVQTPSGWTPAQ